MCANHGEAKEGNAKPGQRGTAAELKSERRGPTRLVAHGRKRGIGSGGSLKEEQEVMEIRV